jgi:predicted ATPase
MLDWSHDLLSEPERVVFRRLSAFAGGFVGLKPVLSVSAFGGLHESMVVDAFDGLVWKSLVAADFSRPVTRYRLLHTTRAYAAAKLQESGEASLVARRHAIWFRDVLVQQNAGLPETSGAALCTEHVGNLRAALEWSLGDDGDREIATALAAAAAVFAR